MPDDLLRKLPKLGKIKLGVAKAHSVVRDFDTL